ncbi:MAG: UPF0149 family protein [Gammaproteobacteria bacterium]|nr:UPF0149 family protein [Gammaproteobacteria bacterium]
MPNLDYLVVNDALSRIDAAMNAAESHAMLCGMLCACGRLEADEWCKKVLEEQDENNVLVQECRRELDKVAAQVQQQLDDREEFSLRLFLPDDETPMAERVEALSKWCECFSFGLGVAVPVCCNGDLPEESQELLKDLLEISKAVMDDEEEDEVEEEAYMQICEYVRMGVLLIRDELQPLRGEIPAIKH